MQVRGKLLEAFEEGTVSTCNTYLIIEHEWMHLETLAYMLAQEQRVKWEGSHGGHPCDPSTAPGTPSKAAGSRAQTESSSGSSDDEAPAHANGHAHRSLVNGGMSCQQSGHAHTNGHVTSSSSNGTANGFSRSMYVPKSNSKQQHEFIEIKSGSVTLGIDLDPSRTFAWDNEGPQQAPQRVSSFQAAVSSVTNSQYYRFAVTAGGYEKAAHWNAKDLALFKKRDQKCPATWTVQVMLLPLYVTLRLLDVHAKHEDASFASNKTARASNESTVSCNRLYAHGSRHVLLQD